MKYYESERVELKREITSEIKKEIVAFLNTSGGTIYIGVSDDGSVYFKDLTDKDKDIIQTKIINWVINDVILPNPKQCLDLAWNSDNVLVLNVAEGSEKPYYLAEYGPDEGTYIRFETSKAKATKDDIAALSLSSHKLYFEDLENSCSNLSFTYFINKYEDLKDKFKALGFLKNDKYTNLAYLFSDEQKNNTKIYFLDNANNIKKRKVFKGSILEQIDKILDFFTSFTSYPYEALKEALLNAFIHRNWQDKTSIKIEVSENKINFISPGGIFLLSSEEIDDGKRSSRNPKLAKLLKYLGYTNNHASNGLKLINSAYAGFNKEAIVMATSKLFIVSLPKFKHKTLND